MIEDIITYTPMYVSIFWSILLLTAGSPVRNRAKFFLGIFMFIAFLLYLSHAIFFQHLYHTFGYFDPIYALSSLSVYPLYYWYIKLLTVETKYNKRNLIMFLPALIISISSAFIYFLMTAEEAENHIRIFYYHQIGSVSQLGQIQKIFFYAARIIFSVQIIYFLIYGSRLVKQYNERIANFYSNIDGRNIIWASWLLVSFVVTSVVSIVFNILGREVFSKSVLLLLIPSIIFSTLLFIIGFQGSLQNYTVAELIKDEVDSPQHNAKQLSREKLKIKLVQLFEDNEIFTNSDLNIKQLADLTNTNRTYLSNLINEEFECTFSDYVGKFRLEKAKKLLESETHLKFSIEYIAEQVGFGSTNSFIRVFKKMEGTTPGNYRISAMRKSVK